MAGFKDPHRFIYDCDSARARSQSGMLGSSPQIAEAARFARASPARFAAEKEECFFTSQSPNGADAPA